MYVKPVRAKPAQEKPFLGKKKSPESGDFGAIFDWAGIGADALRTRPNRGISRGDRGGVRECRGVVLAYSFLPESKTSSSVRCAFPV